jgi:TolB-like protein/Tfp pilus assembly protein PilF
MSFFNELKRRNVFRVGIAYAVATWVLIQIADILLDNFGAPPWVMKSLVVVLFIGFFITLFVAWAFELTPEGVKRESEIDRSKSVAHQTGQKLNYAIIGLLVVALGYFVWESRFASHKGSEPSSRDVTVQTTNARDEQSLLTPAEAIAEPIISQLSIAVLPFDNRSNREEDQFFTDGIHDDLLTTIARIGSMKVISRTSVMEYKNTTKKLPEIAKELGVANILEGGIQRSGDQVRINVQLIDAQTDEHLWAEIFDRELTAKNLFAIQSEISQKIADALKATLTPDETRRINTMPTQDLAAFEAYIRGKQLMTTREVGKLEEAIREFREAVDLDPNFALAWVGISDSFSLLADYGSSNIQEELPIRQEAVNKALAIDPMLGEAYVSLARIHNDRGEHEEMEAAYQRGIEFSPNYATAYHWYSGALAGLSRRQQAVDLMLKAAELDPRSAIIATNLADQYTGLGMYSRAEQLYKKVIELNPGFARVYTGLGIFYGFSQSRVDLAVQSLHTALEIDPGSLLSLGFLVVFSTEIGDIESANQYRQMIADINDQYVGLGWLDMTINHANGNIDGIREAWQWLRSRASVGSSADYAALLELAYGNPANARKIYLDAKPDWIDPGSWGRLVNTDLPAACLVAWTFIQTGDEELGTALLDQSLTFIDTLPGLIENVYSLPLQHCYLVAGDTEKALTHIESQLTHNDLLWWKTNDQLPMYEQIRFEPRYQTAMAERDQRIAEQRKIIEQMNTGTGL